MGDVPKNPFKRPAVREASASSSAAEKGLEEQTFATNDAFQGKFRPPSKATRRIRGEIACAECRRLKIRCDRVVPCTSCAKRGCAVLCPNETIPPGEGGRFVEAATDHLREKMTKLEARMRSLEDALSIVHAPYSDKPHPLLVRTKDDGLFDDTTTTSTTSAAEAAAGKEAAEKKDGPRHALGDHLGTLLVDSQGGSRFFGPSGSSESLLMSQELGVPSSRAIHGPVVRELDPSYLPATVNECYQSFPFSPPNIEVESVQASILSHLPAVERAIALCDIFNQNLAWMYDIVSRQKVVDVLIPVVYKRAQGQYGPHELAFLFVVLAMGCLVDLTLPPYDLEAQHYYRLARATLALQPVLVEQSVMTVKVLHLMSIYNGMSGKEDNLEQSYALLDLASQVALKTGLHVDPSSWGFRGAEAYERRVSFWNLMSGVLWQSLVTGRPPSLLTSYIDCRPPSEEDEAAYRPGEILQGFGAWGHRANSECLRPLAEAVLAAKLPNYQTILELDKKVRQLSVSREELLETQPLTPSTLRVYARSHYRELMLLFLHRAYFAQAMLEHPVDPLNSPHGQSVTAAYSSACVVLRDTRSRFLKKPDLCPRVWRIWSFTFTAAIIVGTVAIRGAHLGLQPHPLEEFEAICRVFETAAASNGRAARGVPILHVMLQKAYAAHQAYQNEGVTVPQDGGDELSFLSGHSRVFYPPKPGPSRASSSNADHTMEEHAGHLIPDPFNEFGQQPVSAHQPALMLAPLPPAFSLGGQHLHQSFADLTGGWSSGAANGYSPNVYDIPPDLDRHMTYAGAGEEQQTPRTYPGQQQLLPPAPSPQYPAEVFPPQYHPQLEHGGRHHWDAYASYGGDPASRGYRQV